ncbi:MAG: hypothetical protein E6K19_00260 [Methanobacteriota archaeon]|nr:MAG: hypothetical protein E6K19_00260 [Euryarchaeota archaeon]
MASPRPPAYGGPMPYRRPIEDYLSHRNVFALNALGLAGIYLGALVGLAAQESTARHFAQFLVLTGGMLASSGSVMGALGSKRTTDIQNLGLFVWAGLLLLVTWQAFMWI